MSSIGSHREEREMSDLNWFEVEAEHCRRIAANSDYSPEGRRAFSDLSRFYEVLAEQEKTLPDAPTSRLPLTRFRIR